MTLLIIILGVYLVGLMIYWMIALPVLRVQILHNLERKEHKLLQIHFENGCSEEAFEAGLSFVRSARQAVASKAQLIAHFPTEEELKTAQDEVSHLRDLVAKESTEYSDTVRKAQDRLVTYYFAQRPAYFIVVPFLLLAGMLVHTCRQYLKAKEDDYTAIALASA